jgi:hypothetical protein
MKSPAAKGSGKVVSKVLIVSWVDPALLSSSRRGNADVPHFLTTYQLFWMSCASRFV